MTQANQETGTERVLVETGLGALEGFQRDGVRVFRGIPYAEPPVGERRFVAPQPPKPWAGVRDATEFGPSAPQPSLMMAALPGIDLGEQSEDCLYLNVFAPADGGSGRPVMVWIHGGGFVIGAGRQSIYDGSALVRRGDVVVVTVNYRLGALGFLDWGAGTDANAGLLDQVAALRWVREHIEAFGGDPDNVTIFGESAGGMSVGTLLGCPSARGLFRRAIAQSGACQSVHDAESSDLVGESMLATLGLSAPDATTLRALPLERLLFAQRQVTFESFGSVAGSSAALLPFQPVVDGHVLPSRPLDAVRQGASRDVALMVGTTRDEWRLFGVFDATLRNLDHAGLVSRLTSQLGGNAAAAERLAEAYRSTRPDADGSAVAIAIDSDRVFRIPAVRLAEAQSATGAPVYNYLFSWEATGFGGVLGACHAVDIPFVFDSFDVDFVSDLVGGGDEARALCETTMDAWLGFARSGDPSHAGTGDWVHYGAERATLELGRKVTLHRDPAGDERQLWDELI